MQKMKNKFVDEISNLLDLQNGGHLRARVQ